MSSKRNFVSPQYITTCYCMLRFSFFFVVAMDVNIHIGPREKRHLDKMPWKLPPQKKLCTKSVFDTITPLTSFVWSLSFWFVFLFCFVLFGSAAAFHVVNRLKHLALDGRTVIASIHQPSSDVFELFDYLYLLSNGKTIYFGPASQAQEVKHYD